MTHFSSRPSRAMSYPVGSCDAAQGMGLNLSRICFLFLLYTYTYSTHNDPDSTRVQCTLKHVRYLQQPLHA